MRFIIISFFVKDISNDTIQQVNAYLLNHHYDGLMKSGSMRNKPQI